MRPSWGPRSSFPTHLYAAAGESGGCGAERIPSDAVGAEGLELEHGEHLLLADGYADFARATAALLLDPVRGAALGAAGRTHVEQRFGWEQLGAELAQLWRSMAAAPK